MYQSLPAKLCTTFETPKHLVNIFRHLDAHCKSTIFAAEIIINTVIIYQLYKIHNRNNILFKNNACRSNIFKHKSFTQPLSHSFHQMRSYNICKYVIIIEYVDILPHSNPPSQSGRIHGSPTPPLVIAV